MNRTVIVIVLAAISLVALSIGAFAYMVTHGMSSLRELGENVAVEDAWTELPVDPPLRIEKQLQEIGLSIDGARTSSQRGVPNRLADGRPIDLEVELKDTDGNWHRLRGGKALITDYDPATETFAAKSLDFAVGEETRTKDPTFVAVRIRSSEPFVISKVRWHVYYMK